MNNPKSRNQNLVVQEIDNEIMIYDLNDDKVYGLNETSAIIWGMCDGTRTIAEISRQMSEKLNTPVSEDYVWLALRDLQKENLLTDEFEIENKFAGMSRRQIIRKIGFASMVALPVVFSLVAPTAVTAASGPVCMNCTRTWQGSSCSSPTGCMTTVCLTPGGCMAGSTTTNSAITTPCSVAGCLVCPPCIVPNGGTTCSILCTMT